MVKSKAKSKDIILFTLSIIFLILPIFTFIFSNIMFKSNYLDYEVIFNSDKLNLKHSKISGKIHVDNNWTAIKAMGICTGNGTYFEPYLIENLEIDAKNSGSCIIIENSNLYFRIVNCTLSNSAGSANGGIKLNNVTHSQLIENICFSNWCGIRLQNSAINIISDNIVNDNNFGIDLMNSNNNTVSGNILNRGDNGIDLSCSNNNSISGNTLNNNDFRGINLFDCNNNIVSGNIVNNVWFGIWIVGFNNYVKENILNFCFLGIHLYNNRNCTLSGNIMNECGLEISGNLEMLSSLNIDTTNLVNDKPLYYYLNKVNLGLHNFTNAGQVFLINCNNSLISNVDTSKCYKGISLRYSYNNTITANIANHNSCGLYLFNSDYNNISGNNLNLCINGIRLSNSDYNNISGNSANNSTDNGYGIGLYYCNSNTISGNTANHNAYGIFLLGSDNNNVSGNVLLENDECIIEFNCQGNKFSDNGSCTYGQGQDPIPENLIFGYNLFFFVSILLILIIILSKQQRIQNRNHF